MHNYKTRLLGDQETRWTRSVEAAVILLDDFKAKDEMTTKTEGIFWEDLGLER